MLIIYRYRHIFIFLISGLHSIELISFYITEMMSPLLIIHCSWVKMNTNRISKGEDDEFYKMSGFIGCETRF